MDLTLDRQAATPLREQIADSIRARIRRGDLHPGTKLPPTRKLAAQLAVNRTTVVESYRTLAEEGLLESGVGQGTFVRFGHAADGATVRQAQPFAWSTLLESSGAPLPAARDIEPAAGHVLLDRAVPNRALFADRQIADTLRRALDRMGGDMFDYASPAGYEPLREALARRMTNRGVDMTRNEVVVVNGSQQGIDLVARLLLRDGGPLAVSRPSFAGALDVFREYRAEFVPVPLDEEGMDLRGGDARRSLRRLRLLYCMPDRHNPTGVTMSEERRARLLHAARRDGFPILEDDWLADLRTDGDPAPLKARDESGHVLYLGTCSKVMAPGFRVGWLVVPSEVFPALVALKRGSDLCTNLPGQVVLTDLIEDGTLDEHAAFVGAELERRRALVDGAIDAHFPTEARPLGPHRGMVLWIPLPWGVDPDRILEQARRGGIELAPSAPFDPAAEGLPGFRISYAAADTAELVPAMKQLGKILNEAIDGGPRDAGPPLV